ncbi:MAG: hypothetical protein COA73_12555 [Candidatus Hydrogenedentota bacterium]|nr:MAG: hypothetical protein COA73_12555 [Candidatus Hydrogenedentota bacterium]
MLESLITRRRDLVGIFMVTAATLMFQIVLTRIFSVSMWYHFAFVAISVSMFGFTIGALLVFFYPKIFTKEKTHYHMALSSLAFGILVIFSFLTQQSIPFMTDVGDSVIALYSILLMYMVLALPFIASGICVCLILTRFPKQVGKLYAADLIGSGMGCLLIIPAMRFTDAPTAVLLVAAIPCIGAIFFSWARGFSGIRNVAVIFTVLLLLGGIVNTLTPDGSAKPLRLRWVMGIIETESRKEYWNDFSRVVVRGNPDNPERKPSAHGLSNMYKGDAKVQQMMIVIDVIGATYLTNINNDPKNAEHLKHLVTNSVHVLRPDSDVLIIGVGGGRDVLSALIFDQKSIIGVEINNNVIKALTEDFADFAGNLHEDPRVTIVVDEGRSYVTRQDRNFDIIQLSFIDTFAAGSAGAFVLTENALYTVESFEEYISHLTDRGMFSVSHFYFRELPIQVYRLTNLAYQSLKNLGVEDPHKHMAILRHADGWEFKTGIDFKTGKLGFDDVATLLISRTPMTEEDIDNLEAYALANDFEVVLSPRGAKNDEFYKLATGQPLVELEASLPVILAAPTDDAPFFFHSLKLRGLFNAEMNKHGLLSVNIRAIKILGYLLGAVILFAAVCVVVPMSRAIKQNASRELLPFLGYFFSIGLGFMLLEMSIMQRLMIFLGYPTYALAVVLFTLLISSGIGSATTQHIPVESAKSAGLKRFAILIVLFLIVQFFGPDLLHYFRGSVTPIRIAIAVGMIAPMGLFMGMAFPLGLTIVSRDHESWSPWFWGINGASSVLGSVLAIAISLNASISASYWTAVVCYLVAIACFAAFPTKAKTN